MSPVPFDPTDPLSFPSEFKNWLIAYIEANPPVLPIGQIFGFTQTQLKAAPPVVTSETSSSGSWGDLATVGPTLSGLADGTYAFWFGATCKASVADTCSANISVSINGDVTAATLNTDSAANYAASQVSISRLVSDKALSAGGNNTVTMKYLTGGVGTATYGTRWLVALRYEPL